MANLEIEYCRLIFRVTGVSPILGNVTKELNSVLIVVWENVLLGRKQSLLWELRDIANWAFFLLLALLRWQ